MEQPELGQSRFPPSRERRVLQGESECVPGSVGVTKLRQMLEQRLEEQMMKERMVPKEPLDLEALLDLDRPLDGEELLDGDESLDSEEPLDYEEASEDLQAWVTRLADAFDGSLT